MPCGRPREFDKEKALEKALSLFWQHGYEGTSIAALSEAIGVFTPSLYAAFGNKETLFKKAFELYDQKYGEYFRNALEEPTARQVAEKLLYGSIDVVTSSQDRSGCFLVQGALVGGPDTDPVRTIMNQKRQEAEQMISQRFKRAVKEGDLPSNADPAILAKFIWTVLLGNSIQAAGGANKKQLTATATLAMQCFSSINHDA